MYTPPFIQYLMWKLKMNVDRCLALLCADILRVYMPYYQLEEYVTLCLVQRISLHFGLLSLY